MKFDLKVLTLILLLTNYSLFAQQSVSTENLIKKSTHLSQNFDSDLEKKFIENEKILIEAIESNNTLAELISLSLKCRYYEKKYDFKNMISTAESLYKRADEVNSVPFKINAKNYLFKAYYFSDLYDKAFYQLQQASKLIHNVKTSDSLTLEAVSNLYISFSNYYLSKNDNANRLKYIRLSIKEHGKFQNKEYKQKLHYIDYANLATVYHEINIDSAEYYAQLSMAENNNYKIGDADFSNLLILGQVNAKRKKYQDALNYFKKAESIIDHKNHLNSDALYDNLSQVYRALGDEENAKRYEEKRSLLKLNVTESQNQSLHKMLNDKEREGRWYKYILVTVGAIAFIFLALFLRKNWILSRQEKLSQSYLSQNNENPTENDYSKLLEMFKKNDLAYITYFNEFFPNFSQKLIQINPALTQNEIEFCSYMKLKIPTKNIVRYKNLAHRTVQNKKYIIRKKLNIPAETDIYYWFESF